MEAQQRIALEKSGFTIKSNGEVEYITCRWCWKVWCFEGFGPLKSAAIEWLIQHEADERKGRK